MDEQDPLLLLLEAHCAVCRTVEAALYAMFDPEDPDPGEEEDDDNIVDIKQIEEHMKKAG